MVGKTDGTPSETAGNGSETLAVEILAEEAVDYGISGAVDGIAVRYWWRCCCSREAGGWRRQYE